MSSGPKCFELAIQNLSDNVQYRLREFRELYRSIAALTDRENTQLLANGNILFDGIWARKLVLMETFEKAVPEIFQLIKKEAPHNHYLRGILLDDMLALKRKLSINSTLHLQDLKVRANRIAALQEGVMHRLPKEEDRKAPCH